jgi:glycosyltransferase involved in cell wall biosynthesis
MAKISFKVKEQFYRFYLVRLTAAILFYINGVICYLNKNFYIAYKFICWTGRVPNINYFKNKSLDQIRKLVVSTRLSNKNSVYSAFLEHAECHKISESYRTLSSEKKRNLRGNLMILKDFNPVTNEKGVMIIGYTPYFKHFLALYDLDITTNQYYIVLEPSWTGYCDETILMFIHKKNKVIVQSPWKEDYDFIVSLESDLVPINIGPNYWVDLDFFHPSEQQTKIYDLLYVANWAEYKQHVMLFRALRKLKSKGHLGIKVALVGFPLEGRTRIDIERELHVWGVEDMCTVFECIPITEVKKLFDLSKTSILLSKKEGSCRAVTESLAANVPVMLYSKHIGGAKNVINENTGILFDFNELPEAILWMRNNHTNFKARRWAEENIGCINTAKKLNELIKSIAISNNEPWTCDIKVKANCPNFVLLKK